MNRNYFYVILGIAAFCLLLVCFSLISDASKSVEPPQYANFPPVPYKSFISGLGIVQASGGNISLGASVDRIVDQILVHAGQEVKEGQILINLQRNDLEADLQIQKVAYDTALLNLRKLQSLPRKEDLVLSELSVKNAGLEFDQAKSQYEMVQGLQKTKALSLEEINRRFYYAQAAEMKLSEAQAEFDKVKQGAWKPDLELAHLQLLQAEANVQRVNAALEKTVIKSPINGTVIEIKTHVGEYPSYPIMVVGNTQELDIKVSINQFDSHYFNPKSKAIAFIQGDPNNQFELEFLRLTPFLVSKQNLANDVKEVVDTKVLQVIYRLKNPNTHIYVGQPMDVYIEADFNP